jgi:DNA-binding NtrC family response regulator
MDTEGIETETGPTLFAWLTGFTLAQIEEGAIRASFTRHNGHRRRMIAELGIGRSTLNRKLTAYGLRKPRSYLFGRP